jgi:predicted HicB family RNase H-like nuclease
MEQLSLFDVREETIGQADCIRFTEEQEEELKREMALAILDFCRKESDDHDQCTGA